MTTARAELERWCTHALVLDDLQGGAHLRVMQKLWMIGAAVLCAATAWSGDVDWPQFRGPAGQGTAAQANPPLTWNRTNNVAWVQRIPGKGWSSPVIKDRRIYITTAVENSNATDTNLSLRALCLESGSGRVRWNRELFSRDGSALVPIHLKNSSASPTPLVEGDRCYIHFGHLGTACIDLDGKMIWRNTNVTYAPVHGGGGSPVVAGRALIFNCDGASNPFIVALNKKTGEELWRTARTSDAKKKFSFSTPLLIEVDGRKQLISQGSGAVWSYDPESGRELWKVRYGEGYSVVPRPVFGHDLLFVATGFDRPTVMAIRPDGEGDVTDTHVAWTVTRGAPNTPSLLLVADELYMVSDAGIASCVDARTGQMHWQERIGGNYSASPIVAGGRIYMQNEEGVGVVLNPGTNFQIVATNVLGERSLASYAVSDDALFIRTAANLYKVKSATRAAGRRRVAAR